jgi:hypothetical protein
VKSASRSVNSIFERLGIDGVVDPDGAATAVKLLPAEEDQSARFETLEIFEPGGIYEIRAADWAGHSDGVDLMVGVQRRRVQSHKVMDRLRLKVVLNTIEVV